MKQNGVIKHLAIALTAAAMPVAALGFNFSINGQTNFSVSGDVHYHTGTGVVEFQVPDHFFCFDFGSGDAQSGLTVKDGDNGVVLMNNVGLGSGLQYRTGNNEIRFQSNNATPCFLTDSSRDGFGLFGFKSDRSTGDGVQQVDCENPENAGVFECDQILGDQFQGFPELVIEYTTPFQLDSGALPLGAQISYAVTIRNVGNVDLQRGAFQELSTIGLLETTALQCTPEANCGAPVEDANGTIRYERLSLDRKDGEVNEVTLQITKEVSQPLGLDIGTEIEFFSGVVSGDGNSSNPVFDSRVTTLPIIE